GFLTFTVTVPLESSLGSRKLTWVGLTKPTYARRGLLKAVRTTLTPSSDVGILPFRKSLSCQERVVTPRLVPKIVIQEFAVTGPAREVAALIIFPTVGAAG